MILKGRYLYNGDDLSSAYYVREQVFHIEQNIPKIIVFDEFDVEATHVVISTDEKVVATGRLYLDGNIYLLDKISVLKEERNKKYGDFVVRMLIDKAFIMGAQEIYINTKIELVPFFKKIGFISIGQNSKDKINNLQEMKLLNGALNKECKSIK